MHGRPRAFRPLVRGFASFPPETAASRRASESRRRGRSPTPQATPCPVPHAPEQGQPSGRCDQRPGILSARHGTNATHRLWTTGNLLSSHGCVRDAACCEQPVAARTGYPTRDGSRAVVRRLVGSRSVTAASPNPSPQAPRLACEAWRIGLVIVGCGYAGRAPTIRSGPYLVLRMIVRRRPTLPHRHQCSTIGAERLSFRVRNGTGRFPLAMTAVTLSY